MTALTRARNLLVALAVIILAATLGIAVTHHSAPTRHRLTVTTCGNGTDSTTVINRLLNAVRPGSTVTLPKGGCWNVTTIQLSGLQNVTINGNGATLRQPIYAGGGEPILFLSQDTGLTINNLNITGSYDGTNGGPQNEGDYGLLMEADTNTTINGLHMTNVCGDFFNLQVPDDISGTEALNLNTTIENSVFSGAGYHGFTIESANRVNIHNNWFVNIALDAMDYEYDGGASDLVTQPGTTLWAAQDNVVVQANIFANFDGEWFASDQGGVQEQNLAFIGNTIDSPSPLVLIGGSDQTQWAPAYWTGPIWFVNNKNHQASLPVHGGSGGSSMEVSNVNNLLLAGNSFPVDPNAYALQVCANRGVNVSGNHFPGGLGIINPICTNPPTYPNTGMVVNNNTQ